MTFLRGGKAAQENGLEPESMTKFLDNASLDDALSHSGTLEVHLLGIVEFSAMLGLQDYLTYEMSGCDQPDGKLFLCEHPPLVSVGREGRSTDLRFDREQPEFQHLPVHWIHRGGGAYAHGPGQLALYAIIPLRRLGIGPVQFRERLESAACRTCRELKIPAKRHPDSPGVWGRGGQLAFFGAGVRSWISNFGLYLNVTIDPLLMDLTHSNREQLAPTSIQAHRKQPLPMPQLRESLIRSIADSFGYANTDVSTGHPLLKRKTPEIPIDLSAKAQI